MAYEVWLYALISVVIVSLVSLIGVLTLSLSNKVLKKLLLFVQFFSWKVRMPQNTALHVGLGRPVRDYLPTIFFFNTFLSCLVPTVKNILTK